MSLSKTKDEIIDQLKVGSKYSEEEISDFQAKMLAVWDRNLTKSALRRREFAEDERKRVIDAIMRHHKGNFGLTATRLAGTLSPQYRDPALLNDMIHRGDLIYARRPSDKRTKQGHIRMEHWYFVASRLTAEQSKELLEESLTGRKAIC